MSANTPPPTLLDSITSCNRTLDRTLQRRFGVTVRTYKLVMALTKLIAVIVGGAALAAGADATTVVLVTGAIAAGPDVIEAIVAESSDDTRD